MTSFIRWDDLVNDLQARPGRVEITWRIALLCAIVTGFAMMYNIPDASLSCYLIIFLMKPDAVLNIITGSGLFILIPGIIAFIAWLINLTQGSTIYVMMAIAIISYIFLYLGAASKLGVKGNVIAMVIAFILTMAVYAPFGDVATLALHDAWAMAAMPMLAMVGFNLILGISPIRLLRDTLQQRLDATIHALEEDNFSNLHTLLNTGNEALLGKVKMIRWLHLRSAGAIEQMTTDIRASYALLLAIAMLPKEVSKDRRDALAQHLHRADAALKANKMPPAVDPASYSSATDEAERSAWQALDMLAGNTRHEDTAPLSKTPFLARDAFHNPAYNRLALKTTGAAIIAFLLYTAIDWPGIHTAMITCYIAALATTGETVHKLILRIAGCLVGAAMGAAAIFWIIPNIHGIGPLMMLIFVGMFVAAWVSTGPERISYAGIQIALAFLLTVLQGFGPSVHLDTAWDRVVGILVGNFIVYVVFTQIWPVPVLTDIRKTMAQALSALAHMARLAPLDRPHATNHAARIEVLAHQGEELMRMLRYEPKATRPAQETQEKLRQSLAAIRSLNQKIWLNPTPALASTAVWLEHLSTHFENDHQDNVAEASEGIDFASIPVAFLGSLQQIQRAAE